MIKSANGTKNEGNLILFVYGFLFPPDRDGDYGARGSDCQRRTHRPLRPGGQDVPQHHDEPDDSAHHPSRGEMLHLQFSAWPIPPKTTGIINWNTTLKKNDFLLQHVLLAVKFFISYAIPDTPHWVATEMAKIEYRRREIEKQVS